MCDTLCAIGTNATYFAKNSDRPVGEAQIVRWFAPRPPSSDSLRTQYLNLGPDHGAFGFLGSQPTWLWGVEHGVNQYGVAVGNEKIWTTNDARNRPQALLGMDVVRLALERATNADATRHIICELIATYGQGGSGERDHDVPYDSSFMVVDADSGWIIETNHRSWAARRVVGHGAISNRISLTDDWDLCSLDANDRFNVQQWRPDAVDTRHADHRLRVTRPGARDAHTAGDIAATLRDHGGHRWGDPLGASTAQPAPIPVDIGDDFEGVTVCMHVRDYQTTAASMIVEWDRAASPDGSPRTPQVWVALGSPCVSIYVPVVIDRVPEVFGSVATWQAFDTLRSIAERDPSVCADIRAAWAGVEAQWWATADAARSAGISPWQPSGSDISTAFSQVFQHFIGTPTSSPTSTPTSTPTSSPPPS